MSGGERIADCHGPFARPTQQEKWEPATAHSTRTSAGTRLPPIVKEFCMNKKITIVLTMFKRMLGVAVVAVTALTPLLAYAAMPAYSPVTSERLINAQQDNGWLMYRRNYESTGYAPFDQINAGNVGKLTIAFNHQSNLFQGHEAAPVVNGKYMFVTTPMDHLIAMDATNGAVLWKYDYPIDKKALKTVCCDVVNRGVALFGDLVYMGTLGNHIVALDAATGEVKWDTALAPPGVGYFITAAPLVDRKS